MIKEIQNLQLINKLFVNLRGIATESSSKGISDEQIQEQGGWTNPRTARLYINKKDKKTREYNKKLLG